MPAWDRTDDFRRLVLLNPKRVGEHERSRGGAHEPHPPLHGGTSAESPEAATLPARRAAAISLQMDEVSAKLGELRKLIRHRGIFEDRSAAIQALTYETRQSIIALNRDIDAFAASTAQEFAGRPPDLAHYETVVQALRTRLAGATRDLKVALEQRAEAMRTQNDRRSLYSSATPFYVANEDVEIGDKAGAEDTRLEMGFGGQMRSHARREPMYHSARVEAVETIQKLIGDLAQIFNRVGSLVTAQEELTLRIDEDVSSALHNTQRGEVELAKYFRSISSNRSLILKVFCVLLVFVIFFALFLS